MCWPSRCARAISPGWQAKSSATSSSAFLRRGNRQKRGTCRCSRKSPCWPRTGSSTSSDGTTTPRPRTGGCGRRPRVCVAPRQPSKAGDVRLLYEIPRSRYDRARRLGVADAPGKPSRRGRRGTGAFLRMCVHSGGKRATAANFPCGDGSAGVTHSRIQAASTRFSRGSERRSTRNESIKWVSKRRQSAKDVAVFHRRNHKWLLRSA